LRKIAAAGNAEFDLGAEDFLLEGVLDEAAWAAQPASRREI
jgi:hypothetical protein